MTRHSIALGLALMATAASTCVGACSASSGAGFGGEDDGGSSSGGSGGGSSGTSSSGTGTSSGASSSHGGSSSSSSGNGSSGGTSSGGGNSSGTSSGSDAGLDAAPMFDAAPPPPYDGGPQVCGVQSGAQLCDLKTHTCCVSQFGVGQCVTHGSSCPNLYAAFSCIAKIDCTTSGQVCCGLANSVSLSASTSCQTAGAGQYCPNAQNPTATMGGAQLCASSAECTMGQSCIPQHCVGSTNFNLCGLHTDSPFSCTQTGSPIP